MIEDWLQILYFQFESSHLQIGRAVCGPVKDKLPAAIQEYCPRMIDGFFTTLELVILALLLAFSIAKILSKALIVGPACLRRPIRLYVYCFQGTPLLIQLWLLYYGLAQFSAVRDSVFWFFLSSGWWIGLLSLTLNSAAYQTNILVGTVRHLPQGQLEGGKSLGLSKYDIYNRVLFPQALRISWPSLTNEAILLLKASALVSTVTVLDLMGHARTIFSRSYDLWVYGNAAMLYITLTGLITLIALGIRRLAMTSLPEDPWFKSLIR